jgi:hypothetical protein
MKCIACERKITEFEIRTGMHICSIPEASYPYVGGMEAMELEYPFFEACWGCEGTCCPILNFTEEEREIFI